MSEEAVEQEISRSPKNLDPETDEALIQLSFLSELSEMSELSKFPLRLIPPASTKWLWNLPDDGAEPVDPVELLEQVERVPISPVAPLWTTKSRGWEVTRLTEGNARYRLRKSGLEDD